MEDVSRYIKVTNILCVLSVIGLLLGNFSLNRSVRLINTFKEGWCKKWL